MRTALVLAERGLGRVAPNPAVGCVIVGAGRVVARGWTQPGGRPHAEAEALARAGAGAHGACVYVTLEPCAHHGATPPCADALIAAGIAHCVVALEDPDPRVAGAGLASLRDAGIGVSLGLGAEAAAEVNAGYLSRQRRGRPLVTLKLATTLDGRIATHSGESRWITSEAARARAHLLRARLVDRLAWFRAPLLIGGDGVPAAAAFGVDRLADAPAFVRRSLAALGPDILESYAKPD